MKVHIGFRKAISIVALISMVLLPIHAVLAASGITLSVFSGAPQTLQVSGWGFSGGETVNLYFNTTSGAPVAHATAEGDSQFTANVLIPPNIPQGPLPILAVGQSSGFSGSNSFYVVGFTPSIIAAASPNTPGSTVEVSGSGFAPGETVNFSINNNVGGHAIADPSGNFTNGLFSIPSLTPGTYLLHATGQASGADAIYYFYIGGFFPGASPSAYYLLPGQQLAFSGSGFAPGETVTVSYNGSEITSFSVPSNGQFTNAGNFTVDNELSGGVRTFDLTSSQTGADIPIMVTVGIFNGMFSPSSYYVLPGQTLSFSGSGFQPLEPIQVSVDGQTLTTFKADNTGSFINAGSVTIPVSYAGLTKHFILTGLVSQSGGGVDITVQGFNPQISPSSYFALPGQNFTISGSGFGMNEPVNISLNGQEKTSVNTDGNGGFSTSSPITAPFSGSLHIVATGQNSASTASTDITLGALYPSVSPSSWYVMPGSLISFTGSGFAAGENVSIADGTTTLGSVAADSSGNFISQNFIVPFAKATIDYKFIGQNSDASASINVTVGALEAIVSADNYYAVPGSTVHIGLSGFAPNEGVNITAGSSSVHTLVDNSGSASSTALTIPLDSSGTLKVLATGDSSGASGFTSITIAPFSVQVSPSTWYTAPGSKVTFSGSGFSPNENISISLNGSSAGFATADAGGQFASSAITIPITAHSADFVFTGSASAASAAVNIGLSGFSPQITPSTWYAGAGSPVNFSGSGFAPGENIIISQNQNVIGTSTADALGNFSSAQFSLPFASGAAAYSFHSSVTQINTTLNITVAPLNPSIVLSTYYNKGGAPITITGYGFGGNEIVNLSFNGAAYASSTTDAAGNFSYSGNVAFGQAGNTTIAATGQSSHASANANFTRAQIYTNIQLGSYAGAPGQAVDFIGSGYLPNEPINITTDRTGTTVVATFNADTQGNFNNSSYILPSTFTGGPLVLTITGTESFSQNQITYYVTGP